MRATADNAKCQAHGVCVLTDPAVFGIGEADGYSYPRVDVISLRRPPQLRRPLDRARKARSRSSADVTRRTVWRDATGKA